MTERVAGKRVLLLVARGTEIYELAAFYDVLGWANEEGDTPLETVTVGLEEEVTCTFGLRVRPDRLLADVDPAEFDALAVPGGFESFGFYEHAFSDAVSELVRAFAGRPIAAICTGALPVARSGVLEGRRATTYALSGGRREQLASLGAEVVDEPVVRDGNVVTSTSPATALDVAFGLLADLTSETNAAEIRRRMGF